MAGQKPSFDDLTRMAGTELGVSSWICVDQSMIDQFAETTRDRQWIHIDVERARRESPYKAPVAHGYLTLSLVAAMSYEIGAAPDGTVAAVNYGLDRVRFLAPVRAGANIRMRSKLISFESKGERRYLMKCHNVVEIEGEEQAALVADTLALLVAAPDGA
ncbi:MaoC family dehydratase [Nitratireductor sp. CAU 1489]|uniref:MaoC family dehydratase n=1 Tax=Nitratireductor arenosus TaxID=2682096 RepID=A0A844Q9E4_9HYPH|nr:MaoC family dehydratase [Nitratireductor arenosus]MVA96696.1 MaoC family dehydratase [Nitratireductor arenosus]